MLRKYIKHFSYILFAWCKPTLAFIQVFVLVLPEMFNQILDPEYK